MGSKISDLPEVMGLNHNDIVEVAIEDGSSPTGFSSRHIKYGNMVSTPSDGMGCRYPIDWGTGGVFENAVDLGDGNYYFLVDLYFSIPVGSVNCCTIEGEELERRILSSASFSINLVASIKSSTDNNVWSTSTISNIWSIIEESTSSYDDDMNPIRGCSYNTRSLHRINLDNSTIQANNQDDATIGTLVANDSIVVNPIFRCGVILCNLR